MNNEQKLYKTLVNGLEHGLRVEVKYHNKNATPEYYWGVETLSIELMWEINLPREVTGKAVKLKPHLRSLSKLTEETEHNGEKFVPYDRLSYLERMDLFESGQVSAQYAVLKKCFDFKDFNLRFMDVGCVLFQKLIEWHFNVFSMDKDNYIEL